MQGVYGFCETVLSGAYFYECSMQHLVHCLCGKIAFFDKIDPSNSVSDLNVTIVISIEIKEGIVFGETPLLYPMMILNSLYWM